MIDGYKNYNPNYEETAPYIDPDEFFDFILKVKFLTEDLNV